MKKLLLITMAFLMLSIASAHTVSAKENSIENFQPRKKRAEDGKPKTVKVKGYVKKNGTYVAPHRRRAPRR